MSESGVRLNKYLSAAGACSRREADRLIEAGEVTIDGRVAGLGDRVEEGQRVFLRGEEIRSKQEEIVLAFYKPAGLICTSEEREGTMNIYQYLRYPKRVFSCGRLDKDSRGLLLMTNLGELSEALMRSTNAHEKEYLVEVDREITDTFLQAMREGVFLRELDRTTRPCRVERDGERRFRIVLTQGLNRQIRRMCEALGYRVRDLLRIRVCDVTLDGLAEGECRELAPEEIQRLKETVDIE